MLATLLSALDIPAMSSDASLAPDFADRLAGAYPVLSSPRLTPLRGGLLHRTFVVEDPGGDFILQRVAEAFSPDVHGNVDAVTTHLESKGMPTFRLQRTAAGALLWHEAGADHRLMTRLPGHTRETCSDPALARSAAAVMARFHSALADFASPLAELGFAYREPEASFGSLSAALESHAGHPLHADVARIAARIDAARGDWPDLGELPERVIHGDLKFSNVLLVRDETASHERRGAAHEPGGEAALALIDLDTVLRRPLYHDLGDAWRSWCNRRPEDDPDAELDLEVFEAIAQGYLDEVTLTLTGEERASFVHALERAALELAARFATDALNESWFAWDAERFGRSGEHQLLRARGQLALHDLARDARPAISEILAG